MFWPMKAIFRENLVTNEYIYDKVLSKMCINKINLRYHVIKYCSTI
jgi:hypothetical protein